MPPPPDVIKATTVTVATDPATGAPVAQAQRDADEELLSKLQLQYTEAADATDTYRQHAEQLARLPRRRPVDRRRAQGAEGPQSAVHHR